MRLISFSEARVAAFLLALSVPALSPRSFASCLGVFSQGSASEASEVLRQDYLQALLLRRLDPSRTITLAVGNLGQAERPLVREVISQASRLGYTVLYDADALSSAWIGKLAGEQGLGLSGRKGRASSDPARRIAVIENTSLRMDAFFFRYNDAFQSGHRLITTLDSLVGVGLLVQNPPNAFVLDGSKKWKSQVKQWVRSLGERGKSLNLPEPREAGRIQTIGQLDLLGLTSHERDPALAKLSLANAEDLADLSEEEKSLALRYAEDVLDGEKKGISSLGGAAVFCSAMGDPVSDRVLAEIGAYLGAAGIPVVTGGSVQTMERVNQAAKKAGGISVGIPIRRPKGHPEFVVPTEAHTLTHLVDAHPARLHFLLEGRKVIFIGPGGKGIMKEIGAILVRAAAEQDSARIPKVVLVDSYYSDLDRFFDEIFLPKAVRSRVVVLPSEAVTREVVLSFFGG